MSEITKNPIVIAGAAGLGGLFIGAMLATATLNNKIKDGVRTALAPALESLEGQGDGAADLGARLDTIEAAVGGNTTALGTLESALADMGGQMQESVTAISAEVQESVTGISAQMDEKLAALQGGLDGLGSQLSETAEAQSASLASALSSIPVVSSVVEPAAEPASQEVAAGGTSDGGGAPAPDSANLGASSDAIGVGQTAVLAGGAVRAFVQRIDPDAGAAVLSINGDSQMIEAGDSVVVRHADGACQVGVSAVSAGGVGIASDCDAPLGSAEIGEAYAPGTVAMFSEGKLRVFVSGVVDGDARLAVNGLETQLVAVGQSVNVSTDAGDCTVTVSGVRGTAVALQGDCS